LLYTVVLDTCVLYPAHLCDTLLRLAERQLYRPLWSADILQELERNLAEVVAADAAAYRVGEMKRAFPDAAVSGYGQLVGSMTCDPKDRHVLAAAARANAAAVITFNVSDFPPQSTEPLEIDVIHPDDFLLDLADLAREIVRDEIGRQAEANRRSPRTVDELAEALERGGVPKFAELLRGANDP